MKRLNRAFGIAGIAGRQLLYNRARTLFAILGIVIAVLAVTLLFGVANGVIDTGEELVEDTDRDLWVSGGPIELSPQSAGGFRNPIVDSHNLSTQIESHQGVNNAIPLAFNLVYTGTDPDELDTVFGTGVPGGGPALTLDEGDGFTGGDTHYADGAYDGPMSYQVVIDPATAEEYNVGVGDTLHVGGTLRDAQRNEFEIVGISSTFSDLSGTQTVTIRLSELQTLTGMAMTDRSSLMMVTLHDDADQEQVITELEEAHPELDIRTNREQVTEVLESQVVLVVGGFALVAMAFITGLFFSFNIFLSLIYQQRQKFAVYQAIGGSTSSVVGIALAQGVAIVSIGLLLGLGLTPVLAEVIERLTVTITGFEGLVNVPQEAYVVATALVLVFGLLGTLLAIWRIARGNLLTSLQAT